MQVPDLWATRTPAGRSPSRRVVRTSGVIHPKSRSGCSISDVEKGLAHAMNDIGLIPLPDGRRIAIAVFVTDSTADQVACEQVIARIARAVYDASLKSTRSTR